MTLTKADIVKAIFEDLGFSKKKSVETVETLLELIKGSLASGEDLMLRPRKVVTFKCSGKLRDRVNRS